MITTIITVIFTLIALFFTFYTIKTNRDTMKIYEELDKQMEARHKRKMKEILDSDEKVKEFYEKVK